MLNILKNLKNKIKFYCGLWNIIAGEFLIKDLKVLSAKDNNNFLSKVFYMAALPKYDLNPKLHNNCINMYYGVLKKYGIYISWSTDAKKVYNLFKKEYDNKTIYKMC